MARLPSPSDPAAKDEKAAVDFVQRSKKLIVQRKLQEAVKICRLGLLAHPTLVEGRLVLGMALMALGRHDEVLAEMRAALELEPQSPMAHLLKGEALYYKKDFGQAQEVLRTAQELDPLNPKVVKLLQELERFIDYGQPPEPVARTETRVYPSPLARKIEATREISSVAGTSEPDEWDEDEDEDEDNDFTSIDDSRPAFEDADADADEAEDERYITAPYLPPTYLAQLRRGAGQSQELVPDLALDDEETLAENQEMEPGLEPHDTGDGARSRTRSGPGPLQGSIPESRARGGATPSPAGEPEALLAEQDEEPDGFAGELEHQAPGPLPSTLRGPDGVPSRSALVPAGSFHPPFSQGPGEPEEGQEPEEELAAVGDSVWDQPTVSGEDEPDQIEMAGEQPKWRRSAQDQVLGWEMADAVAGGPDEEVMEDPTVASDVEPYFDREQEQPAELPGAEAWDLVVRHDEATVDYKSGRSTNSPQGAGIAPEVEHWEVEGAELPAEDGEGERPDNVDLHPLDPGTHVPLSRDRRAPTLNVREGRSPAISSLDLDADLEDLQTQAGGDLPSPEALFGEESALRERSDASWSGSSPPRVPTQSTQSININDADELAAEQSLSQEAKALRGEPPRIFEGSVPRIEQVSVIPEAEVQQEEGGLVPLSTSDLSDISLEILPDSGQMPPLPVDGVEAGELEGGGPEAGAVEEIERCEVAEEMDLVQGWEEPRPSEGVEEPYEEGVEEPYEEGVEEPYEEEVEEPYEEGVEEPYEEGVEPYEEEVEESYEEEVEEDEEDEEATRVKIDLADEELEQYLVEEDEPTLSAGADELRDPIAQAYPQELGEEAYHHGDAYGDGHGPVGGEGLGEGVYYGDDDQEEFEPGRPYPDPERFPEMDGYEPDGQGALPGAGPYPDPGEYRDEGGYAADRSFYDGYPPAREDEVGDPFEQGAAEDRRYGEAGEEEQDPWNPRGRRTENMEEDDGRAYPYGSERRPPPGEELSNWAGITFDPETSEALQPDPTRSPLEPEPMGPEAFHRQSVSPTRDVKSLRVRSRRPPLERTSTSLLDLLRGKPGSHRPIFLILGVAGVVGVAVGVGLAVRYMRLGEQIEERQAKAVARLRAGNFTDFQAATQAYAEILRRRPDDVQVLWAQTRVQAAIPFEFGDQVPQDHQQMEEQVPVSADRIAADIYIALFSGSLERALATWEQGTQHFPKSPLLQYLEGRIRLFEGQSGVAQLILEKANQAEPTDLLTLQWLGESQAIQGHIEQALKTFDIALQRNPDHVGTLLARARALLDARSDAERVEQDLRSILSKSGKRRLSSSKGQLQWARLLQARFLLQAGQGASALALLAEVNAEAKDNRIEHDPLFLDQLVLVCIESFQLEEAEAVLQKSLGFMKGRPHPHLLMARILLLRGNPQDALTEWNKAKGLRIPQALLLKARILVELGRLDEAERETRSVLDLSRDLLDAYLVKAQILAARGQAAQAEGMLRSLLPKHSRSFVLLTSLGDFCLKGGKFREAEQSFRDALQVSSGSLETVLKLAEVYLAKGDMAEAERELAKVERATDARGFVLRRLAELLSSMGKWSQARGVYERLVKQSPGDPRALLGLAGIHTALYELSQAEAQITSAERQQASAVDLALAKGRLDLARGKYSRAVRQLEAATSRYAKNAEAWDLLVQAHLLSGDEQKAKSAAEALGRHLPDSPDAEVALGRVELNRAAAARAVRHFARALQLLQTSPSSPVSRARTLVLLGRTYRDAGQLHQALGQFEEAIRVCPTCAEPYYRRGVALDENGMIPEAIRMLKKAVSLNPRMMEVYYDLGQVYERAQKVELAIEAFNKYLSLKPPEELAEAARDMIKSLQNQ